MAKFHHRRPHCVGKGAASGRRFPTGSSAGGNIKCFSEKMGRGRRSSSTMIVRCGVARGQQTLHKALYPAPTLRRFFRGSRVRNLRVFGLARLYTIRRQCWRLAVAVGRCFGVWTSRSVFSRIGFANTFLPAGIMFTLGALTPVARVGRVGGLHGAIVQSWLRRTCNDGLCRCRRARWREPWRVSRGSRTSITEQGLPQDTVAAIEAGPCGVPLVRHPGRTRAVRTAIGSRRFRPMVATAVRSVTTVRIRNENHNRSLAAAVSYRLSADHSWVSRWWPWLRHGARATAVLYHRTLVVIKAAWIRLHRPEHACV